MDHTYGVKVTFIQVVKIRIIWVFALLLHYSKRVKFVWKETKSLHFRMHIELQHIVNRLVMKETQTFNWWNNYNVHVCFFVLKFISCSYVQVKMAVNFMKFFAENHCFVFRQFSLFSVMLMFKFTSILNCSVL